MKPILERQLRRQALWLKESWLWVMITKVLPHCGGRPDTPPNMMELFSAAGFEDGAPGAKGSKEDARPSALDVGCGPGYVMDIFRPALVVKGVDIDGDMVELCKARGLDVRKAPAEKLPFKDKSFDIVYCTFLLLWVKDPARVLKEMARVSKKWVLCLAEPDYGARIDHPAELAEVGRLVGSVMKDEGADPHLGRKLRTIYSQAGLEAEVGLHAGVWDLPRLKAEFEDEWAWVEKAGKARGVPEARLIKWKRAWSKAIEDGGLFQFNPIFYAIGRKD